MMEGNEFTALKSNTTVYRLAPLLPLRMFHLELQWQDPYKTTTKPPTLSTDNASELLT